MGHVRNSLLVANILLFDSLFKRTSFCRYTTKIPIFPSFLPDGYVTTAIGKWHLGHEPPWLPCSQELRRRIETKHHLPHAR